MNAALLKGIGFACIAFVFAFGGFISNGAAQGYVIFNNRIPGQLIAPIFGAEPDNPLLQLDGNPTNGFPVGTTIYHGPPLEGTGYTAQLWAGPGGATENQLVAIATTTFLTGVGAGFVQAQSSPVVVPAPAGGQAVVQWRVWKNLGGTVTSWAGVLAAGSVPRRASGLFSVSPGSTPATAAAIPGLRSFNITCLSCGTKPALFPQLYDRSAIVGEGVTFILNVMGELPITYQWLFNGAPLPSEPPSGHVISSGGLTSVLLTLSNVQPSQAGLYSLIASNDLGTTVSSNAVLSVYSPPLLRDPAYEPGSGLSFTLTGAPNRAYSVSASSNLTSWFPLATITNLSGTVPFTDTSATNVPVRFYRAASLPLP